MFMNQWDIEDAVQRWGYHPVLGPAARTLQTLESWTDSNSDGWAHWPKPARAAKQLMELLEEARRASREHRDLPDRAAVRMAYRPIKAFRTRQHGGMPYFEIEEV